MLTLFTTAKPFKGHIATIQRNTLQSWKMLHPHAEVILFGDDEGGAEVCAELDLRHEPMVARTDSGAIRLDDMFRKAQTLARHDVLCYANCDILLLDDFVRALERVLRAHRQFLMVGRRWDTDITEPIDFSRPNWREEARNRALATGHRHNAWTIDYFAFRRGLYGADTQPLAIGRFWWDHWLIRKALDSGSQVIDASRMVLAIHQNHDFSHHPQGWQGIWTGEEARRNFELAGGWTQLRGILDATEVLTPKGLKPNIYRHWSAFRRLAISAGIFFRFKVWHPIWFAILDLTRPLRTALGLRSQAMPRSRWKT
jgi:hypothetical protein